MRKRQDNRGSAMMIVIVVIAFVSILIATLFMMTVINIQMKSVDRAAKENFYSAEGALEQITLGLQKELADASSNAYVLVMQQYAGNTLEVERRRIFNDKLLAEVKTSLENHKMVGQYDIDYLKAYLSEDIAGYVDVSSSGGQRIVSESDSLVLKGVVVTFTDAAQYQSVIETDIRLSAPNLNLIQPSDMPDVFEYSIIANEKLVASAGSKVEIKAGVYAGEQGLTLTDGAVWDFKQANRLIVKGDINIPRTAALKISNDMDLWAQGINVMGGTLAARGRTYVANDLVLNNRGSNVTLEGEYYGYGNGSMLTDAGLTISQGGDSSAILINGTNSTLDMGNMRRLLLSGSAQIATGDVTYDPERLENILPENEPGLSKQIERATISSGSYYLQSVGNGKIVRSAEYYAVASTAADTQINTGSWELLSIVLNDDNTISFMDLYDHKNKYISVQTEDQNILAASADKIGINEKFCLWVYTKDNVNYYALQSYATGKFVSIDNYYPAGDTTPVAFVLCANRDKVTDDAQLFRMTRWGASPTVKDEPVYEPVVVLSYESGNQLSIEFGFSKWGETIPGDESAWVDYTVTRRGRRIAADKQKMLTTTLARRLYYNISGLQKGDVITYTITYTKDGDENNTGSVSGTYTNRPGYGNTASEDVKLADGIYFIRCTAFSDYDYLQRDQDKAFKCVTSSPPESNGSWEEFILVNNHDNTISFKSVVAKGYYLSVQADGSLKTTAAEIGSNERFKLVQVGDDEDHYRLQTVEGSNGNGKYLYVNRDQKITTALGSNWVCVADENMVAEENQKMGYFWFDWLRITDETGTQPELVIPPAPVNQNPVAGMEYESENSAKVSFSSPYWSQGNVGNVKLFYRIGVGEYRPEVAMTVSGLTATCIVSHLESQDRITYYFVYEYVADGVSYTKTTANYVYIHETKYGEAININEPNSNVNLGESIEVKSNQIAYLVPPECIGVYNGETLIGKNPMSDVEFTKLMSYAGNTVKYPGFEIVSFTKEVEGLGKSLDSYRNAGEDGYRTIFVPTSDGTMVYFYVEFDADNTSAYFRDYYAKNQDALESYMRNYVNEIKLSSRFTRLTTGGNMVYSANGSTGRIDLRSNEGYGADLSAVELSSLRNEEEGYQKRFKALTSKLMLDYGELTQVEKVRALFDNLVRFSEEPGEADSHAFAGWPSAGAIPITYTVDGVQAQIVHNIGKEAYHYNGDPEQKTCLILATGDVVLEQDFSGVVIARGTVTVTENVRRISGNQEALYKILRSKLDSENPDSETILNHYFRDGNLYILDSPIDAAVTDGDYVSYAELVTYEDWTKR